MDEIKENAYIYGIRINDEMVYIGKTFRPIAQRLEEHALLNAHNQELEEAMKKNNYDFVILYESHNIISNEELEQIERTLIENIKPKYNILGVTKPYNLYATKEKYKYKKERRYVGLTDLEAEGIMSLNPLFVDGMVWGSITSISQYFVDKNLFGKATHENFYQAFGKPNTYTDLTWTNYGPYGFCFKTTILEVPNEQPRLLTKEEMEQGLPKDKNYIRHPGGVVAFLWVQDVKQEISLIREQQVEAIKRKEYETCACLEETLSHYNLKELVNNYNDLQYRMSNIYRPKVQETGKPGHYFIIADDKSYYDRIYD